MLLPAKDVGGSGIGRRVMDRFQGYFGNISRKDKNTLITDHFSSSNHREIEDIEMCVLDFIHLNSKIENSKALK